MAKAIELTAEQLSNLDILIGETQEALYCLCTDSLETIAETLETLEGGEGLQNAREAVYMAFGESLKNVSVEHLIEIRKNAIAKK